jgi:tRNA 5-methylaminomethyl-2-thiouridine biosynthesis bifunctional protein
MNPAAEPIRPAAVEFLAGGLRSTAFGDSYFTPGQGLEESRAVFILGNGLPARFEALSPDSCFVIGENGFGCGLNALLAADCFDRHAAPGARLRILSSEKHPLLAPDLERALDGFPSLARWRDRLVAAYPPPVPGHHRLALSDRIDLVLMLGDSEAIWPQLPQGIDAWFLDGFAPACNPGMWTRTLFDAMAACSRPGATLSTFTAAGLVRRGLASAGFEVRKVPGFAAKRDRLAGRWPGTWRPAALKRGTALVAGAGLAGATTARALADRGWQVRVLDRQGPASGASGNSAGVLYTTPSAHLTPQNRFYQTAFVRAREWFRHYGFPAGPEDGRLNDVIQYPTSDKHRDKLEQALSSGAWPGDLLSRRPDGGFVLHGGGYLHPPGWIRHLLDHPSIHLESGEIRSIRDDGRLELADGRTLKATAAVLCLAHHTAAVKPLDWLFLKRIRGQVSEFAPTEVSAAWTQAVCHGGYLTPALDGRHCVGATYDLKRPGHGIDPADDPINLEQLRAFLPQRWAELGGAAAHLVGRRASVRCQSPDFLPQAGLLPDPRQHPHGDFEGVYMNIAHGSRGLTHTPLTADLLADRISGIVSSIEPELITALAPERFILRKRRRQPHWVPGRRSSG